MAKALTNEHMAELHRLVLQFGGARLVEREAARLLVDCGREGLVLIDLLDPVARYPLAQFRSVVLTDKGRHALVQWSKRPAAPVPWPSRIPPTPRQRELLEFIRGYIEEHGSAPSVQEMAAALGLDSKSSAFRMIGALEERGWVHRIRGRSRAIAIVDHAEGAG